MKIVPSVKICGLKDADVAYDAAVLGARFIGIICVKQSRRYVDINLGRQICDKAKMGGAIPVAVCTEQTEIEMRHLAKEMNIDTFQLHGELSRKSHKHLPDHIRRIYVLHVNTSGDIININDSSLKYLDPKRDFLLFDGLTGGSGKCININGDIKTITKGYRYFIAGGLDSRLIKTVIDAYSPFGLDVSTGVEDNDGNKEPEKIAEFIRVANNEVRNDE